MFILRCIDLYIKNGGFTHNVEEAKRWKTKRAAVRACPRYWNVVPYEPEKDHYDARGCDQASGC